MGTNVLRVENTFLYLFDVCVKVVVDGSVRITRARIAVDANNDDDAKVAVKHSVLFSLSMSGCSELLGYDAMLRFKVAVD